MKVHLKEIANRLGLSTSTISLVMNGRGDEMGISKATQDRVQEAAKAMNYQPSGYQKRKSETVTLSNTKRIAVFWCADFSDQTMGQFFMGLHRTMKENDYNVSFYIKLFEYGNLRAHEAFLTHTHYNGIIISGTSNQDMDFLNEGAFDSPIVLLNRSSERYHCVYVNDYEIGCRSAQLFYERQHKKIGLITLKKRSYSVGLRQLGFLDTCQKHKLEINDEWIQEASGRDYHAGYLAACQLLASSDRPTALFVMSPGQVLGVVEACREADINIPEDLEVLTFGNDAILPLYAPSISTVHIPIESIAEHALKLLMTVLNHNIQMPMSRMLLADFTYRESCGS